MSDPLINKVAESGLISLDLAQYIPNNEIVVFDIKPYLPHHRIACRVFVYYDYYKHQHCEICEIWRLEM